MTEVEMWTNRIREIEALLAPLEDERRALKQKVLEANSPFKVGDVIEWSNGTHRGRVVRVLRWVCDAWFEWRVQRIKKDGSAGVECMVRHYHNPRRVE